jgi:hypothetical protein
MSNSPFGKDVVFELTIKLRIFTADPLDHHRGVLFLLIAVVRENLLKLLILSRLTDRLA